MTQAVRHGHTNPLSLVLKDTKEHPIEGGLAALTLVLGAIAAVTSVWAGLHLVSAWVGLIGVLVGARGQYVSATTGERFVLIIGMGAAGLGCYLGIMHGGLVS